MNPLGDAISSCNLLNYKKIKSLVFCEKYTGLFNVLIFLVIFGGSNRPPDATLFRKVLCDALFFLPDAM